MENQSRCPWCSDDPLYMEYHDKHWGKPTHNEKELFEYLILECMQAGLSWITILKKQENYRQALDNYDIEKIANYNQDKIDSLLQNQGIIRNKLKVNAIVGNAKAFIKVQEEYGSFDSFIWKYVDNKPIVSHLKASDPPIANTPLSDKISKDLKKLGFKFVGSTIIYSFMQAIGMVDDHVVECFLHS